jgi:tRNA(fMet)-specific endonuclease VapC
MLQFLFDTDHLTLYEYRHPLVTKRFAAQPADTVGVSAVTIEESLRGRLAFLSRAKNGAERVQRYDYLLRTLAILCQLPRVQFDQPSENQFQQLLTLKLHIGRQDQKIAAIALANTLTLVTRNRRDFGQIPGLILDDWSV